MSRTYAVLLLCSAGRDRWLGRLAGQRPAGLSFSSNLYLSEALVGALVGYAWACLSAITEGVVTRNPVQAVRSGVFSGLLGLAAGAIGLPLSEYLFQFVGAGFIRTCVRLGAYSVC